MLVPNPIRFAYMLLMGAYLTVGAVALLGALLLMMWPRARRTARRLAAGVIGSFPFVLFFQGLSSPILTAITIITFIFDIWSGPANGPKLIAAESALALELLIFLAASVAGGVTGYGVGARMAAGTSMRLALAGSRILSGLAAGLNRVLPISAAVTPAGAMVAGVGVVILAVAGLAFARMAYVERYGSSEIDYRGEKFQLARKHVDYDDYKDDPNNLAPSEIARVEKLMTQARIGPDFANWKEFVDQAFKIKFPGYGMGPGPRVLGAGREFAVEVIEVPQAGKDRYFILEKNSGGSLRLVDDFVIAHKPGSAYWAISSIRLVDEKLVYSDRSSNVVRETNIGPRR